MNKKLIATLLVGAMLLATAALAWPKQSQAATLSGGTYTYVVDGEEVTFPLDPIVQKNGVLLPLDVFTSLGVSVNGALEKEVVLSYGPVSAKLTVGRVTAEVMGETKPLPVAPVRLNGRLFLPAQLLESFGIAFSQEGNYVTLTRYVAKMPALTKLSPAEWRALKDDRTVRASVKADSAIYLDGEFTLLNAAMLADENLPLDYGTRARLMGLLETNSLLLVTLSNKSLKSGALQTTGIYLVDQYRNQYEVTGTIDVGQGLISNKVAPAADRMGVLLLPKLESGAGPIKLYYEGNGTIIGQFVTGQ